MEGLYMGYLGASQRRTVAAVQGRCVCVDLCFGKASSSSAVILVRYAFLAHTTL